MALDPLPYCPHIFCLFHFFKKDIILFFGRCLDIPSSQSHCGWYLATRLSHSKRQPPLVITPKSQNSSYWLLCGLTCQKQHRRVRKSDYEKDFLRRVVIAIVADFHIQAKSRTICGWESDCGGAGQVLTDER